MNAKKKKNARMFKNSMVGRRESPLFGVGLRPWEMKKESWTVKKGKKNLGVLQGGGG